MKSFFFCYSRNILISPFLKDSFAAHGNSWLMEESFVLAFQINIIMPSGLHGFWWEMLLISQKILYSHFSLVIFKILCFCLSTVWLCVSVRISFELLGVCWDFGFVDSCFSLFLQIFCFILSSPSGTHIMHMFVTHLIVSHGSVRLSSLHFFPSAPQTQ